MATKKDKTTLPAEEAGKVQTIIDLMQSVDSLQEASELCTKINMTPALYNLVMGGVPPVQSLPEPAPVEKTPAEIEAELKEKLRAEILAELEKQKQPE
jgi:hypothetical protein